MAISEWEKGLNLLNVINGTSIAGVTVAVNNDKTITITGTSTSANAVRIYANLKDLSAGQYTISFEGNAPSELILWNNGEPLFVSSGQTFNITNFSQDYMQFNTSNGTTYNYSFKIMLVEGDHAYPYQPYSGPIVHWGEIPLENIHDNQGNLRFIEGNGINQSASGIIITYNKWSLSGTHLMLVLAGTIASGTVIENPTIRCLFELPTWVLNKIYPVMSSYLKIEKTNAYGSSGELEEFGYLCYKGSSTIGIESYGNTTITSDKGFRIQIDLLIDNE